MTTRIIEITTQGGVPLGAYIYLAPGPRSSLPVVTERIQDGIMVDRREPDGLPVGIEIIEFGGGLVSQVNEVLLSVGELPLTPEEARVLLVGASAL